MSHVRMKAGSSHGKEEIPQKRGRGRPVGSTNKIKWVKGFPGYSKFPFLLKNGRTQGGESTSCKIDHPLQNGMNNQTASSEVIVCIKRGRGRPRKLESELKREQGPKNPRGRPRKIQKVPEDEDEFVSQRPNNGIGKMEVDFRSKLRKRNHYESEFEATTSNVGPQQVLHEIHPPGVYSQRGWTREAAMLAEELSPPGRETQGPQCPGWETVPSQVNWVPGGIPDPSGTSTVTHWFVEEPQVPRPASYPEGPVEQREFREDLLQGLADFRHQLTRELAAARGEMREGAELVRSAIDGVAAEIHRLGLLLQPLVTVLTSGGMMYPTQPTPNSPSFNTLLRHQQDTPPDDPPSVSHQSNLSANPIGISQQGTFPIKTMCSSQSDAYSRNTQSPCQPTSIHIISPSPQQQDLTYSQTQEDPPKDSIPLLECTPLIKRFYPRKEKCHGTSTDCLPQDFSNSQTHSAPEKVVLPVIDRPVTFRRIYQRKDRFNGSTDDPSQERASPSKSTSALKQDVSPSQFSSIDEDGKTIIVDYPSFDKISNSQEKIPAVSDDPAQVQLTPALDYLMSENPNTVTLPSSRSPPVQARGTEASLRDVSTARHVDMVSELS